MKKRLLNQFLISLGFIGIILTALTLIIYYRGIPTHEVEAITFEVDYSIADTDKGKRIVEMACKSCHYDHATGQLTGRFMTNISPSLGKVYSSNITNHKVNGIGGWTDEELAYFLRTGIRPNGELVPLSYMTRLVHLSDEDLKSLIAFLRSDDTLVESHSKTIAHSEASLLTKLEYTFNSATKISYPKKTIQRPTNEDTVDLGKYLVLNFGCFSCHTNSKTQNELEPEKSSGYLGGGNRLFDQNGNLVLTPNITMDSTGIGSWNKSDFVLAVKKGVHPFENTNYESPMQAYSQLSDYEVEAIFDYIKTIKAVSNEIKN